MTQYKKKDSITCSKDSTFGTSYLLNIQIFEVWQSGMVYNLHIVSHLEINIKHSPTVVYNNFFRFDTLEQVLLENQQSW